MQRATRQRISDLSGWIAAIVLLVFGTIYEARHEIHTRKIEKHAELLQLREEWGVAIARLEREIYDRASDRWRLADQIILSQQQAEVWQQIQERYDSLPEWPTVKRSEEKNEAENWTRPESAKR